MMFLFLLLICCVVAQDQDDPIDPPVQTPPLEPLDSQNLALVPDEPSIPIPIPLPHLGSGEMNYGPSIPSVIDQFIQQIWYHPFDAKNQPDPECKPRIIPFGGPFKMFAFCCGASPKDMGGSRTSIRLEERRKECFPWTRSPECNYKTIFCCLCRSKNRNGFECKKLYEDNPSNPNDPTLNPASNNHKRNFISMKRRQPHLSPPPRPTLPSQQLIETRQNPPPEDNDDDTSIAMDLGGDLDMSEYQNSGSVSESVCKPEYLISQGIKPRRKRPKDPFKPPKYEPWRMQDEEWEDYSDLQPPPGWPNP